LYPEYGYNLLTINTLGHRLSREWRGDYLRSPCLARCQPGGDLAVLRLQNLDDLTLEFYPDPTLEEDHELASVEPSAPDEHDADDTDGVM
ncbi:hypothetical protein ACFL5T_01790, partial [Gemmatimonadota bacterium]